MLELGENVTPYPILSQKWPDGTVYLEAFIEGWSGAMRFPLDYLEKVGPGWGFVKAVMQAMVVESGQLHRRSMDGLAGPLIDDNEILTQCSALFTPSG